MVETHFFDIPESQLACLFFDFKSLEKNQNKLNLTSPNQGIWSYDLYALTGGSRPPDPPDNLRLATIANLFNFPSGLLRL